MIDHLSLYGVYDDSVMFDKTAQHFAKLVQAGEFERARGMIETTAWLARSAYNEIFRRYPASVRTVMQSMPQEAKQ